LVFKRYHAGEEHLNQPGTSQIQQNKAALSRNENVPHGRKFISDEERIEQQMA